METASLIPPIAAPPHDPRSLLLSARTCWRDGVLEGVEIAPTDKALALAPLPESGRSLTEPNGSFGGLVLPGNVALGCDGSVYLLDRQQAIVKRFDPCRCLFEPLPCLGGMGEDPRQFMNPACIGITCGNLFVCDTGNHRVQVFALRGLVLRGSLVPAADAALTHRWEPFAIAFDSQARIYVSDPANGCIHVFAPNGRWRSTLSGFGNVTHITIDRKDRLYILVEGESEIRITDLDGATLAQQSRRDRVADSFDPLPFPVDPNGNLGLGGLCRSVGVEPSLQPGLFDLDGNPIPAYKSIPAPLYEGHGRYISQALDSQVYQCQWHRVTLHAELPKGTRIHLMTYTAETEQPIELIRDLDDRVWQTQQTLSARTGDGWDCLVRSGPGRFLWLKLQLRGNGFATPSISKVYLEFPRISLARYLPAVFRADPVAGDFTDRFLAIFDTTLRSIEWQIDHQARLFDPMSAPAADRNGGKSDFLSWLASWLGIVLDRRWPVIKRRRLLRQSGELLRWRGTRCGLHRLLLLYLGLDLKDCGPEIPCSAKACSKPHASTWQPPPLILEHFQLRRWLFLGAGRLGDQARLWGERIVNRSQLNEGARLGTSQLKSTQDPLRDPFHVYAHIFSVFVPACFERSAPHRKALERLLETERPAHTKHQIVYVEPRFRIGIQSMIGFDAVIGTYPEGVTVDVTLLGRASVLGQVRRRGPSMEVGSEARVGTTTRLG